MADEVDKFLLPTDLQQNWSTNMENSRKRYRKTHRIQNLKFPFMKYRYAQQLGRVARDRVTESGTDLCENVLNSCEIVSKDIENSLALFHNIHRRL